VVAPAVQKIAEGECHGQRRDAHPGHTAGRLQVDLEHVSHGDRRHHQHRLRAQVLVVQVDAYRLDKIQAYQGELDLRKPMLSRALQTLHGMDLGKLSPPPCGPASRTGPADQVTPVP
jgi:hypothetical protein